VWAPPAALVPASPSDSRNTLVVSLFETRSIGDAVMAVCGSPDAKPIVTVTEQWLDPHRAIPGDGPQRDETRAGHQCRSKK
jgi:hypothetical protein